MLVATKVADIMAVQTAKRSTDAEIDHDAKRQAMKDKDWFEETLHAKNLAKGRPDGGILLLLF
jgi:hypothetical protein